MVAEEVPPGPSGEHIAQEITEADLLAADRDFDAGIQALKGNDLGEAIELFAKVLQTRIAKYGDTAIECASAYYRYGSSLFYQAQEESDVFGAPLQQAAENQQLLATDVHKEKENINAQGKGKDKVVEDPARFAQRNPAEEEDSDDEEGGGPGGGEEEAETDMQLAWQMLEVARTIYSREPDAYTAELADVHLQLGDISMEEESFEAALADYKTALALRQRIDKVPDRRAAELQYKMALVLQYLNDPAEALAACQAALQTCNARLAHLRSLIASSGNTSDAAQTPNQPPPGGTAPPPNVPVETHQASGACESHVGAGARGEGAETAAASGAQEAPAGPVSDPCGGGGETARDAGGETGPSSDNAPAGGSAPEIAAGDGAAAGGSSGAPAEPACVGPEPAAAAVDKDAVEKEISDLETVMEDLREKMAEIKEALAAAASQKEMVREAFSQLSGVLGGGPLGTGSAGSIRFASSSGPAAPATSGPSAVQDLGVVGRGSKRIQLQPISPATAPRVGQEAPAADPPKPKRALEDLMGGPAGDTTIGFGTAACQKKLKPCGGPGNDHDTPGDTAAPRNVLTPSKTHGQQ